MSLFADAISAALESLESDLTDGLYPPLIETEDGEQYPCIPGTLGRQLDVIEGGYEAQVTLPIFVRRDAFLAPVTADSTLITADTDVISADSQRQGLTFDDDLTTDSTKVTVDSDEISADDQRKVPVSGQRLKYEQRWYRILDRQEVESHFKFILVHEHAR